MNFVMIKLQLQAKEAGRTQSNYSCDGCIIHKNKVSLIPSLLVFRFCLSL